MRKLLSQEIVTQSDLDTIAFSREFARELKGGEVIALSGPLGVGKTTFTKGLIHALTGIDLSEILSPTFTYHIPYEGELTVHHFDFYRIVKNKTLFDLDDFVNENSICCIEWPEMTQKPLPPHTIHISFAYDKNERRIVIEDQS